MPTTPRPSVAPLCAGLTAAVLLAAAAPADAQVGWDSPSLMAPGAPAGWGVHLFDPDPGDLGVFGTWRADPAPVGLGFRVGIAEGVRDDLAILGGVDVSGPIHRGTGDPPLDVIWFVGAGLGLEDDILLSFPAGISLGWTFAGDEVGFRPWVAPKVVLDAWLGDDHGPGPGRFGGRDDTDLSAALELGIELTFSPTLAIRAAASLGDRDAVSIGIQLPRR